MTTDERNCLLKAYQILLANSERLRQDPFYSADYPILIIEDKEEKAGTITPKLSELLESEVMEENENDH